MERRSRPLFTPLELLRFWLRDYGLALLIIAILCALIAGLVLWLRSGTAGPDLAEQARIIRFGYYDSEWRPRVVVVVRTRGGVTRQLVASPQKLRHCRAGDPIMLVRRGAGLFVHSRGCRGLGTSSILPNGAADIS